MTQWKCGVNGALLAGLLSVAATLSGQVLADEKRLDLLGEPFSGPRSTEDSIPFTPVGERQLGQAALRGLPRETLEKGEFVEILVEPVMYSEAFRGGKDLDRDLIRYQQLLLLVQDQGRQQQLQQQQQMLMMPPLQFRQDGRQYSPDSNVRTLQP
ncbi:MAG: hypothetical protein EA349_11890 [Halomonadaceae bacterium]|nr:MAG: hypothetical protein EA349_11890 [Halomonadaceae bacterium]